jgi:hypothetical protein
VKLKPSIDKTPMARLANPEEVADGIIFLCSDRATYITGTTLTVSKSELTHCTVSADTRPRWMVVTLQLNDLWRFTICL